MKNKSKVFIATSSFNEKINQAYKTLKVIKNPLKKKLTSEQLIFYARDCEYIIAGTENYNKNTINKLNKLKSVFRMGSGTDNIDIDYLKKKKIKFFKSKITPEIAVAELIVGYILSFYRDILEHDKNIKKSIWQKKMGLILKGKTLGIIGYGKIGRYLYKILKSFGVKLIVNDKKKLIQKQYNLETLIKKSDIVSININLAAKQQILNRDKLRLCKKNCLIINTSRPEAIDNNFLFYLLKKNKILGACMDVFDKEPYYGKFAKLNNVILTPHIGSYSQEIRSEMEKEAIRFVLNAQRSN